VTDARRNVVERSEIFDDALTHVVGPSEVFDDVLTHVVAHLRSSTTR
jgi:hypothetical protein